VNVGARFDICRGTVGERLPRAVGTVDDAAVIARALRGLSTSDAVADFAAGRGGAESMAIGRADAISASL